MRTLYLDCGMGAAGDMLAAALLELLPDPDEFVRELNGLGIPGVVFKKESAVKCGITGTHMAVTVNGEEEESYDHHHELDHAHSHDHGHDHSYDHNHSHDSAHSHDHGHDHSHEHNHSHDHNSVRSHDHAHTHDPAHGHTHHHSSLHDIEHIVRGHLPLPRRVQDDIMAVYALIAEAESHAHGVPVSEIHFHEVGTMDAVADITAVCMLMDRLADRKSVV